MYAPIFLPSKTVYWSVGMQQYMTETIKKPILRATAILFNPDASKMQKLRAFKMLWDAFEAMKGLPEPTKETTWHPNSHNLIDLRDWLFECCTLNTLRMGFIRHFINFVIILIDFDPPWRWIWDSLRDKAFEMDWKPRGWNDTWKNSYEWWKEMPHKEVQNSSV